MQKISDPLLDRIDIHIEVPAVPFEELSAKATTTESSAMMRENVKSLGLSARAHDKILRVARTIADIAGCDKIEEEHLAEAISYRNLDADLWV